MLPQPLHPAIVHFPLALATILPLAVGWGLFRSLRRASLTEAWTPAAAIALLLVVGATLAVETGEDQEEVVEAVLSESVLHDHEEAAELFQRSAIAVVIVLALALVPAIPQRAARALQIIALIGSAVLLPLLWRAGGTGGELVYEHGAAAAYVDGGGQLEPGDSRFGVRECEDDEDSERGD